MFLCVSKYLDLNFFLRALLSQALKFSIPRLRQETFPLEEELEELSGAACGDSGDGGDIEGANLLDP